MTVTGFIKTRINFVEGEICCSKANVKVNRGNKGAVGYKLACDPTFTQKSPPPPTLSAGVSHIAGQDTILLTPPSNGLFTIQ